MKTTAALLTATFVTAVLVGCTPLSSASNAPVSARTSTQATTPPAMDPGSGMSQQSGATLETATPPTVTGAALVGQKIFLTGMTSRGAIKFTGGSDDVGSGACANCHGKNGGGGDGPMISYAMLTSSAKMSGMPKYVYQNPAQVVDSVTTGVRPDKTHLGVAMPRYQLTTADAAALIAYLKALK